jgi:hypothetical protein
MVSAGCWEIQCIMVVGEHSKIQRIIHHHHDGCGCGEVPELAEDVEMEEKRRAERGAER